MASTLRWISTSLDGLDRDLRYALRQMIRTPGFTALAVLTLALGIGGTTAMFSVVNAVVLTPLPYAQADRLVWVGEAPPHGMEEEFTPGPHFLEWRERSRTLEHIGAYSGQHLTLTGAGDPERLEGIRASAGFLSMLGVAPLLGRHFLPAEDRPGSERVVMLAHGVWQRRFGADPDVVGRTIRLDDHSYAVVGVLPRDFSFFQASELWVPLALDPEREGRQYVSNLRAIARLGPRVTRWDAQAELEAIRRSYENSKPAGLPVLDGLARVTPLQDILVGNTRQLLFVLLGAVSLVLLIACANVASLLLSRAITRQREFAVRAALGAPRLRLIRQTLTESLLLAVIGGTLGLFAAIWLTGVLGQLTAPNAVGDISEVATIAVDLRVLAFTAVVALLTGILFGLAPAFQLTRTDVAASLKGVRTEGGARSRGLRHLLTIGEVALTIVLLAGAGLLVRSFVKIVHVDPGYRPENLLTMRVTLPRVRYPQRSHREVFFREVLGRISSLPAVQSVAAVNSLPLMGGMFRGWPTVPGRPGAGDDQAPEESPTPIAIVSPAYFRTMGIELRAGRSFTESDRADAPRVVVLSEALARKLFPGEDAVGREIVVPGSGKGTPTVIGVVRDVRHEGLDRDVMPQVYVPLWQSPWDSMTLVVRAASDPLPLAAAVRNEVLAVDPQLPVYDVQTMEQRLADSVSPRRANLFLVGAFALLALTLAAVGVYGVIAYAVTQRTREFGIRIALGATGADVVKLLIAQGLMLVAAGVALGLFGAWALTRLLADLLFGVTAMDPVVIAGSAAVLVVVALVACYVPARRAAPINPIVALRCE